MTDLFPIDWSAFHFLRPQFLWGFVAVAVLLILGIFSLREKAQWQKYIAPHLRPYVINKGSGRVKIFMQIMLALGLSLGILALAGPTWKKAKVPGQTLETPMVILLDLSQSMLTDDIQPTRLERAKFKINDLVDANPGARIALIGYAGTPHVIVPLTRDYKIIKSHVESLSPKVMPFRGSDLKKALALADTVMSVTDAPGTILIFRDDFDQSDFELIQKQSQDSGNKIDIMPMATPSGGDVPAYSGSGSLHYKGEVVHSGLNSTLLARINSLDSVQVHQLTLDNSDVEAIAKTVSQNLKFKKKDKEKKDEWRDVGIYLIIPLALILLLWFRRGWVIYSLLLMVSLTSCKQDVSSFKDLWFTKDYQGERAAEKGDYSAAAKLYQDPLRKGVAYFKAADYEAAIKQFSKDTTAMGAYNLGLAYFKTGDYAAAEMAFGIAQDLDPEMPEAQENQQQMQRMLAGTSEANPEDAEEAKPDRKQAKNRENESSEDLSGGGQKATKKDMEKQRLEESVKSDIHTAKEMDEVPDDVEVTKQSPGQKVLLRKIDDDPSRFLEKKFEFQVKKEKLKPNPDDKAW